MVFKPDPVQDSGFGFWPGHRVGRVNPYLKKNSKQLRFSKKKKSQRVATRFCQVVRSHQIMAFPIFHQPDLILVPDLPAKSGQVLKLCFQVLKHKHTSIHNIIAMIITTTRFSISLSLFSKKEVFFNFVCHQQPKP